MLQQLALLTLLTIGAEAEPSDPIVLEGRVVGPDERPVEGAVVCLMYECEDGWPGDRCYLGSARSDENGCFRLVASREAPDGASIELQVVQFGVGQLRLPFAEVKKLGQQLELALDPPATVELVLLLSRESELVDQDLFVQATPLPETPFSWIMKLSELPMQVLEPTKVGGHIRRARIDLIPGAASFRVIGRHSSVVIHREADLGLEPGDHRRRMIDLSGRIRFRVVDQHTRAPVPKAEIRTLLLEEGPGPNEYKAQADENGLVTILDVPPHQQCVIQVGKYGYSWTSLVMQVPGPAEELEDIAIERSAMIIGTVHLPNGRKIGGDDVRAIVEVGDDWDAIQVSRKGGFRLEDLPPGVQLEIHFEINGDPIGEPQEIVLKPGEKRRITFEL
ncbi:MAG: carboxypeptidase-like regulatory domain-containing protein [Planctomycetota bacterium]